MVIATQGPTLLRVNDVCRMLGLSRASVYRLVDAGELAIVTIGPGTKSRRITAQSVYAYVAKL